MRLSQTAAYALHASVQLAQSNSNVPVPCNRLANEGGMPERFLLQVLRTLVTQGILHSTRGVDGGYSLRRPAAEVSVLEVIEAVDGPIHPALPPGANLPEEAGVRLSDALARAAEAVRACLQAITLADLLPNGTHVGWWPSEK